MPKKLSKNKKQEENLSTRVMQNHPSLRQMSLSEYNTHGAVRSSDLGYLFISPAHYWAHINNRKKSTKSQEFGSVAHIAILEPRRFYQEYAALPQGVDLRTKAGMGAKEHIEAQGKTPVKFDEFTAIENMVTAVYANKTASECIADGLVERSIFWKHPKTGIELKARPDVIRQMGIIVEIKTTSEIADFERQIINFSYYRQAAMQVDGLQTVLGIKNAKHITIAVESEAPHTIRVFKYEPDFIEYGRQEYESALDILKLAQDKNEYPGFPEGIFPLALPDFLHGK